MIEFTPEELRTSKISIIGHNISLDLFNDKELPTDTHLLKYKVHNKIFVDAVRGYTKVDIFDEYYEKVKCLGGVILEIENGYGMVRPNLYGRIGKEDKKSKN